MSAASISIVIPTCGRAASLHACLDSLRGQTDLDFEAVIAIDGADANVREAVAAFAAPFRIVFAEIPENRGPAHARNAGARIARSSLLFFVDDDMSLSPRCVALHKAFHADHEDGRWVAMGHLCETYGHPPSTFAEAMLRSERFPHAADPERFAREMAKLERSMTVFCGNNCSIGRDAYLAAGGADEQLRVAEDLELGVRLSLDGFRFCVLPEAWATHRNEKNLEAHYAAHCKASIRSEIHSLRSNGRLPQVRALAARSQGNVGRSARGSLVGSSPRLARSMADLSLKAANRWRSPSALRAWRALVADLAFDDALREEAISVSELASLVGQPLRALGLHSIAPIGSPDDAQHGMSPARFAAIVDHVRRCGYRFAGLDALRQGFTGPGVCLTFDDGYEDFLVNAAPVLLERAIPATVFIVPGLAGKHNEWDAAAGLSRRRLLDASQIRELHGLGFAIGCHSMTHADLTQLDRRGLQREVTDAKQLLEDILGTAVDAFAYPYGRFDIAARAAVAAAGFRWAFGVAAGFNWCDDPLALKRIGVSERDSLFDIRLKLATGRSRWQEWRNSARSHAYRASRLFAQ